MDIILFEIYRFLFILSMIYLVYFLGDFGIKTYARFVLNVETIFVLTNKSKLILWGSLGLIITFLTKTFII